MADFDFPPHLIDLRQRYDQADAKVNDLLGEGGEALRQARAERLDIVMKLYADDWFSGVNQFKAREALKVAAREAAGAGE
jgi:hypothetical protein